MSFFKKALGAFVDFDEKKAVKQTAQKQEVVSEPSTEIPSESFNFDGAGVPDGLVNTEIASSQGAFNQEFYQHLQNEIENNDQDGADYFEFRKVFEAMKKSMPEAAALAAAFNALKATSPELTVERLIETADFYLNVVDKEDTDFLNQYESEFATEVTGRDEAINGEMETQAELQAKLQESQERVKTLQAERVAEANKLNSVKANWEVTSKLVRKNIETDKKNINTYLTKESV